ncbi:MAG: phage tail protein [Bacteroidota bacterium]
MDEFLTYPAPGFHFAVYFNGLAPSPIDLSFQSVSGLTVTIETEPLNAGGPSYLHKDLPVGLKFENLKLKRGLKPTPSPLTKWCEHAFEDFKFKPLDLLIVLMDENHLPLHSWKVIQAYPCKYDIGEFNAETASVVIETLELKYQYFKTIY